MLSVLLGTTTLTMNRGEQETLYRQARNLRMHQDSKAQQNSVNSGNKPRHHSYGNIHQIHSTTSLHNPHKQVMNLRSSAQFGHDACDDLVLSVLKTPLRDQSLASNLSSVAATSVNSDSVEGGSVNRMSAITTLTTTTINDNNNASSPQGSGRYRTLQASEDDLAVDDVELSMETTELNDKNGNNNNNADLSPYGLKFLRRFRAPKFEAAHHRRVPTPMRRKHNRSRSKSSADTLDGVNNASGGANEGDEEAALPDGPRENLEGGETIIVDSSNDRLDKLYFLEAKEHFITYMIKTYIYI